MRPATPTPGGALRRATGVLLLLLGLGAMAAACAAAIPRAVTPTPPTTPGAPTAPADPAPAGPPTRITVDAIDVDAPIVPVGLLPDGAMQTPDRGRAGWYEPGPRPGEAGAAVVVGHVDSTAGPDVFHRLRDLRPGHDVAVTDDTGRTHRFRVTRVDQVPKDRLPVDQVWDDPPGAVLRLITCGGAFDPHTGHYRDNVIVWARSVTGS